MTQYSGAVVPNPEAIRQQQVISSWMDKCFKLITAMHDGHITEEQQKILWRTEFKKHAIDYCSPAIQLNDLLKPRPLNFEGRK